MDNREKVIKGLECHLKELSIGKACKECTYWADNPCEINVIADALALLKEQEQKLVHVTAYINRRKIGECPNCGKMINSGDYPNYCGRCGQAVKWG